MTRRTISRAVSRRIIRASWTAGWAPGRRELMDARDCRLGALKRLGLEGDREGWIDGRGTRMGKPSGSGRGWVWGSSGDQAVGWARRPRRRSTATEPKMMWVASSKGWLASWNTANAIGEMTRKLAR